jgi:transposase IS66 family protein
MAGILQADAYDGYNQLYLAGRHPAPIREAACWVHARRPFFAMADIEENARRKAAGNKEIPFSPIAIEVVRRIDALFEIERSINGKNPEERLQVRQTLSRPLVEELQVYMREQLAKLSRGHDLAKAFNYILKRWASFTLFLEDTRVLVVLREPMASSGLREGEASRSFRRDRTPPRRLRMGIGLHPVPKIRRHRVKMVNGTEGKPWRRVGSSHASSSLRGSADQRARRLRWSV